VRERWRGMRVRVRLEMLVRWINREGLYRMVGQSNSYTCNKIANGIMENHGWKTMGGKEKTLINFELKVN
jgi:hypothetical protein